MKSKLYHIQAGRMQVKQGCQWEPCLIINEGEKILDRNNCEPASIWDYKQLPSIFSVNVTGLMETLETVCKSMNGGKY